MDDLKVTLIQSDLHWEEIDANLAMFEEKIWKIEEETDLIVLPEMFSTGFSMNVSQLAEPMNSKTFRWMKQQAEQKKAVVAGSYIVQEQGKYFNRFLAVRPDGSFESYDKKHLFGLAGEDKDFTRGEDRLIFEIKDWKIQPLICYDLRFPVWARSTQGDELYDYDLGIYVANWPKPRINAWDTLLQARAIENQSYVIGVNRIGKDGVGMDYVGHSAAYDYLGRDIVLLGSEDTLKTVILEKPAMYSFREKYPFQKDADPFTLS